MIIRPVVLQLTWATRSTSSARSPAPAAPGPSARVRWISTVACTLRCLTLADLPSKTAERMFLERVPLPDDVRLGLWLDDPAEAWGFRRMLAGRLVRSRGELAGSWWHEEVRPVLEQVRQRGLCPPPRDIQTYLSYGLDHA